MNFRYLHKWSCFLRPLLHGLKHSLGKSGEVLTNGHLAKRTLHQSNIFKSASYNCQFGSAVFRATQNLTKRQAWSICHTQVFHTSSRRSIHPVLWLFIKPIAKISAIVTGRSLRRWFRSLDATQRRKLWAAIKRHWYIPAGISVTLAGSAGVYYFSHLEETPITGRKRFIAFTHDQIVKIAEAEAMQLLETYQGKQYSLRDPQGFRVLQVAQRLLAANPELRRMQFKEWKIHVIRDPLVNACVLPSGHMFVFDGILHIANTQDQLAIILGHEMAHAVLEHAVEELSMGRFVDVFVIMCLAAIWCIIPVDGLALITHWYFDKVIKLLTHMPHSRKLEKEADKVGLMFAAKACYDVRQGSVLWTKMSHHEKLNDEATSILPEWMLTHPDSLKRAKHLDHLQPEAEKWREEMRCPKLPPADPREAIKVLSNEIDNIIIAGRTGQDLRRVHRHPGQVLATKTS